MIKYVNQWLPEMTPTAYVIVLMQRKTSTKNNYNINNKIVQKISNLG